MSTDLIPRITEPISAYDLLTKVCEVITEEPKRYYQEWWVLRLGQEPPRGVDPVPAYPACGTVCCVAGWIETLRRGPMDTSARGVAEAAARALGFFDDETWQTEDLFTGEAIACLAEEKGIAVPRVGTPEYAALGVEHIQTFQAKYADQLKATIVEPVR